MEDSSYFLFTSDMLSRYWQKPVWVMEMNRKDGGPSGEEIHKFMARAVEGGATGVFYFQWRDNHRDGGRYGVVDDRNKRKSQYVGLASALRWLKSREEAIFASPQPSPDLYLVWPTQAIGEATGSKSPAWALHEVARRIADGGLRVSLVAEEVIHAIEPAKVLALRDGRLIVGKNGVSPVQSRGTGWLNSD